MRGGIPECFAAKCAFGCGTTIDTRAEGTHQKTTGWVKVRSAGGGHGISLPERLPEWACKHCIESRSKGTLHQIKMFR
jgi:hypothetical protein